jgi:hypothetical protein
MIGFNGGLIGINRTYGATAASPGVWTLDETLPTKRKVVASGGTVTEITDPVNGFLYTLHSFTSTGDTSFIVAQGGVCEYLIIGGGSGGNTGTAFVNYGNGGAAGVARTGNATVAAQTYTITVLGQQLAILPLVATVLHWESQQRAATEAPALGEQVRLTPISAAALIPHHSIAVAAQAQAQTEALQQAAPVSQAHSPDPP